MVDTSLICKPKVRTTTINMSTNYNHYMYQIDFEYLTHLGLSFRIFLDHNGVTKSKVLQVYLYRQEELKKLNLHFAPIQDLKKVDRWLCNNRDFIHRYFREECPETRMKLVFFTQF